MSNKPYNKQKQAPDELIPIKTNKQKQQSQTCKTENQREKRLSLYL